MSTARKSATVSVPNAGQAIGVGKNKAYEMARNGTFPVRVLKLGARYRVPVADLDRYLGLGEHLEATG